ncbi:MAG: DUF4837 family protein [Bacteroidia bacterium]
MQQTAAIALLVCCFFSCTDAAVKRNSLGDINEVNIIVSDVLWNGSVGDSIRKKFAAPVEGLVQEEPIFTLNQYRDQSFDSDIKRNRNIVVLEKGEGLKLEFRYKQDPYRKPQNVLHLTGKNTAELQQAIQMYADDIIRNIHQTELSVCQKQNVETGLRDTTYFRRQFGIDIKIPITYKAAIKNDNFIWLKKEIQGGNTSLLVYRVPYSTVEKNRDLVNNIVQIRDSVGNMYIHGREAGTFMVTEASYAPSQFMTGFKDHHALETHGNWEMKNDFMSGPFINFCIRDPKNKCYLVVEGFIYSPSSPKRDLLLELEAIIRSAKFI